MRKNYAGLLIQAILMLPLVVAGYSCEGSENKPYAIGEELVVCLHFSKLNKKMATKVTVDQYSSVKVNGLFKEVKNSHENTAQSLTFQASNASSLSYVFLDFFQKKKPFYEDGKVTKVLNAVIRLTKGVVTSIEWDNDCFDCSGSDCSSVVLSSGINDKNCVVPECSNGSYEKCDFDLFLSFIGTDKDGNYMKSAAMRMSQFQRYSLTDVYHF